MRAEWKEYWKQFYLNSLGGLKWSSILCMIFFVVYLPILKTTEYWMSFKICLGYSISVQMYLMLCFGIAMAVQTRQNIKYKVSRKLRTSFYFILSGLAACLGLVQGIYIKYWLLGGTWPQYTEVIFSFLTGLVLAIMFVFRGLYKDAKEKNQQLKAANTEAELHVFKNQMQPHFLFNSLNSLMSLIETKSADASVMTQQLANLYREILVNSSMHVATLESEISIIKKYLSLERFRFGDRMSFKISTPDNMQNIFLPPLILQTLVENAVKHGIVQVINTGEIQVVIEQKETGYQATVKNTGQLDDMSSYRGTGIKNSRARLGLIYGEKHDFQIHQVADTVEVRFWFSGEAFQ